MAGMVWPIIPCCTSVALQGCNGFCRLGPKVTLMRIAAFILIFLPVFLAGQTTLRLEQIMQGEDYIGHSPDMPWWSPDSKTIYFRWNKEAGLLPKLYAADRLGAIREVPFEEEQRVPPARLAWDTARKRAVYASRGDLYLFDKAGDHTVRLTATTVQESQPVWTADGTGITYQANGNLFTYYWPSGLLRQWTDFRTGKEKKEPEKADQAAWLEADQLRLFGVLAERKAKTMAEKAHQDSLKKGDLPMPIYLEDRRLTGLTMDPGCRWVTYILAHDNRATATSVTDYVTESGYAAELKGRPKVGESPVLSAFYCYDILLDTVFEIKTDSLSGIRDKPAYMREYVHDSLPFDALWKHPRPVRFHGPVWSEKGLALMELKSQDNKDRWMVLFDPASMTFIQIDHQRDTAWIGGPGIYGWNEVAGQSGWLADGETAWFLSEATGFAHLYTHHVPSGTRKALTSGQWEVLNAELAPDKSAFILKANAGGPFEQHIYQLAVSGGRLEPLTSEKGFHDVSLSPDGRMLALRSSSSRKPWEIYLKETQRNAIPLQITRSSTESFRQYAWIEPEIVWVPASDGVAVPARLYKPSPDKANGAGIIFVHGAGYLQNVHYGWSSYFREYMFHHLLMEKGYTVLDMDYRGSSGYGRDWRTAIYRHMGGRDLDDHIDGALYLVNEHGVLRERVGIYGGSYGGFITLMALFKYPGVFACGAALRSVTDWAHYNHGYTSNILNTPVDDPESFRRSSPIEFAAGLQDPLLMLHGMVDVNVQFQDVVRLSQRLIELRKENWELAVYPMEDHGFREPSSWLDEYRRILLHFDTYLRP